MKGRFEEKKRAPRSHRGALVGSLFLVFCRWTHKPGVLLRVDRIVMGEVDMAVMSTAAPNRKHKIYCGFFLRLKGVFTLRKGTPKESTGACTLFVFLSCRWWSDVTAK